LIVILETKFIDFDYIKEFYKYDPYFASRYTVCVKLVKMVAFRIFFFSNRYDYVYLKIYKSLLVKRYTS